jgi:quercetin dioxygenase-like cupin family protein
VRDAEWWTSERRGARRPFESESGQEAFLVLSGVCKLLVEGEERLLRPWGFFHAPSGTEHIFVGAGDGPCERRRPPDWNRLPRA